MGLYLSMATRMRGNGLMGKLLRDILWKENASRAPRSRFANVRLLDSLSPQGVMGGLTPEQLDKYLHLITRYGGFNKDTINAIFKLPDELFAKAASQLSTKRLAEMFISAAGIRTAEFSELNKLISLLSDEQLAGAISEIGYKDTIDKVFRYIDKDRLERIVGNLNKDKLAGFITKINAEKLADILLSPKLTEERSEQVLDSIKTVSYSAYCEVVFRMSLK